jgi:hypothetical protein
MVSSAALAGNPPTISAVYVPGTVFLGHGSLKILGASFTPGGTVSVVIENCEASFLRILPVASSPGGVISGEVPCACGGSATVTAFDLGSGSSATATPPLPC